MQSRRVAWVLFPMLCFLFGAITPRTSAQGTSTPEERAAGGPDVTW